MLLCVYFLSIWPDYMLFESKFYVSFFFFNFRDVL